MRPLFLKNNLFQNPEAAWGQEYPKESNLKGVVLDTQGAP